MAIVVQKRRWLTKPSYPVELNQSHFLVQAGDLFAVIQLGLGGGPPRNLVNGKPLTLGSSGTPKQSVGLDGTSDQAAVNNDWWSLGAADAIGLSSTALTVATVRQKADATNRVSGILGASVDGNATRWSCHCPWSDGNLYFDAGNDTTGRLTIGGLTHTGLQRMVFAAGPRGSQVFQNGKSVGAKTSFAMNYTWPASAFGLGGWPWHNTDSEHFYLWVLSLHQWVVSEAIEWSAEPYAILRPRRIVSFYFPTAAAPSTVIGHGKLLSHTRNRLVMMQ